MPESSDSSASDPTSPDKAPTGKPPEAMPAKAQTAEPLSLVPRSRSGQKDAPAPVAPTGPPAGPASPGDFANWIKMFAAAMETNQAPPPETTKPGAKLQRNALPKAQRKFQRYDRESGSPEKPASAGEASATETAAPGTTEDPVEEGAAVDAEKKASAASSLVPIALTGGPSNRRPKPVAERRPYFWLAVQVAMFLLLIIVFFLGRASAPKAAAVVTKNSAPAAPTFGNDSKPTYELPPEAAKLIDQAMAAEQDRKFPEATALLQKVQKDYTHVRDVDYRLALLALENGDAAKALQLLNTTIASDEQAAAAYKLRGTILNRRGGARQGMNDFENSVEIDPFSAENFYFWGEALRKLGKPQAALERLQQAIDRLREPALETQYRLKIRLTQIELGQEQEFAEEMAKKLAENPPVPDWLLTAAALELHRGNSVAAAGYLEKAALYIDKDLFELRMRDYYFYGYRFEKPVAKFFAFAASAPVAPSGSPVGEFAPPPADLPDAKSMLNTAPQPAAPLPTGTP